MKVYTGASSAPFPGRNYSSGFFPNFSRCNIWTLSDAENKTVLSGIKSVFSYIPGKVVQELCAQWS